MKRAVLAYETGRMAVRYGLFHGSEWHRSENDADGAWHKPSNHSSGATSRLKAADIKYNKKMMCDEEVFDKHNALVDYLLGVQCRRMPADTPALTQPKGHSDLAELCIFHTYDNGIELCKQRKRIGKTSTFGHVAAFAATPCHGNSLLGGEPPSCLLTLGQAPKPCPPRAAAAASVPCRAATGPEETQAGRAIRPSPHVYK